MKYVYPAVFTQEENGQYSIHFPDIPNCFTGADTLYDGLFMANDALCLMLYDAEDRGLPINPPSDIRSIVVEPNEFATLISCDTAVCQEFFRKQASAKSA